MERMQRSGRYHQGRFENPTPTEMMLPGSFMNTLSEWFRGGQVREPHEPLPVVRPDPASLTRTPPSGLMATWLGHNMVLIHLGGARILTDPVFSTRVTPVRGVGPRRFFPSPISASEMPPLDVVLISHDHYDHLDMPSIEALVDRTRHFVVPLGVGAHLRAWGVPRDRIVELGWWEVARPRPDLAIVCTPARHFSGRGVLDRNKTLWASFALVGRHRRVFFGGDTGYFHEFKKIGDKLGPFDLTLIPIGAYGRGWPLIHLNPEEAVRVHQDLRGALLLPVHWGTFNLATHAFTEPAERLLVAGREHRVALALPRPGEAVSPGTAPPVARWWPEVPWQPASSADSKLLPAAASSR